MLGDGYKRHFSINSTEADRLCNFFPFKVWNNSNSKMGFSFLSFCFSTANLLRNMRFKGSKTADKNSIDNFRHNPAYRLGNSMVIEKFINTKDIIFLPAS